jgi:methionine-rich copper-binding protein CopC
VAVVVLLLAAAGGAGVSGLATAAGAAPNGGAGGAGRVGVAEPAGVGHAKVVGSEPADGAVVERAPERVALIVDAKPATVEGDPLRVYGPDGHRIDDGHTSVSDGGRRISVGLAPAAEQPAGRYEIVYRIVSADTHLIAGRFGFSAQAASPSARGAGAAGTAGQLLHGWPEEHYPALLAATGLGLVVVRLAWRRRRPAAERQPPLLPPMQGHLVADRPAYRPRSAVAPGATAHHPPGTVHGRPR